VLIVGNPTRADDLARAGDLASVNQVMRTRPLLPQVSSGARPGPGRPWLVTAAGQQALLGPNVMRHVEQSLEATAALGFDQTTRLAIWRAVDSYTMGHAQIRPGRDHSEGNAAPDPGRAAAVEAYLQDLAGSGSFPNLAASGAVGLLHSDHDELTFETGLNWLLTGIAADA
jgi:hypothetical protein